LDDVSTIEKLLKLRESESTDQWKKLSSAEKTSIQKGLEDADAGNLKDHSEAQKIYGKWLSNQAQRDRDSLLFRKQTESR